MLYLAPKLVRAMSTNVIPSASVEPALSGGEVQAPRRGSVDTITLDKELNDVRSAKIMIVDDEDLVIRVIKRFLANDGYGNFVTLTDSTKAMDAIYEEKPDVVLLDIVMPEVTGLDLLSRRRRIAEIQRIPFIILSANSEAKTKRNALELGATEFLNKPVDPFDLVLRVQNALMVKRHYDHLESYASKLGKGSSPSDCPAGKLSRTDHSLPGPCCRISGQ